MSKEERIQEIRELEIADRLGISLGYLKDPFTTAISAEAAMKIWYALIAAEAKLEPQTVAETDLHKIIGDLSLMAALCDQSDIADAIRKVREKLVQRIHSPAPDTKGPK